MDDYGLFVRLPWVHEQGMFMKNAAKEAGPGFMA